MWFVVLGPAPFATVTGPDETNETGSEFPVFRVAVAVLGTYRHCGLARIVLLILGVIHSGVRSKTHLDTLVKLSKGRMSNGFGDRGFISS